MTAHKSALFLTARALAAAALLTSAFACATPGNAPAASSGAEKLAVLEHRFSAFVSRDLSRGPENEVLVSADLMRSLERQTRALQSLRLAYLDVVSAAEKRPQLQLLALLRIGELHLDYAARLRRVAYPKDATDAERSRFDAELSRRATPLEATGLGVLRQAQQVAQTHRIADRFASRVDAYLALHRGDVLSRRDVDALSAELSPRLAYPAPRRLLEPLRVGQRAARR